MFSCCKWKKYFRERCVCNLFVIVSLFYWRGMLLTNIYTILKSKSLVVLFLCCFSSIKKSFCFLSNLQRQFVFFFKFIQYVWDFFVQVFYWEGWQLMIVDKLPSVVKWQIYFIDNHVSFVTFWFWGFIFKYNILFYTFVWL